MIKCKEPTLTKEQFLAQFPHTCTLTDELDRIKTLCNEIHGCQVYQILNRIVIRHEDQYWCSN